MASPAPPPIVRVFFNFVFVGFICGLICHQHDLSIREIHLEGYDLVNFFRVVQFYWFSVTWYIVFAAIFLVGLEKGLQVLLSTLVGHPYELQCIYVLQILFGLWIAGQVVGSWLDWNGKSDCMRTQDCESYFMNALMNSMERVCEHFIAYDYDSRREVYYLERDNYCAAVFHSIPLLLMCTTGTVLSYILLLVV